MSAGTAALVATGMVLAGCSGSSTPSAAPRLTPESLSTPAATSPAGASGSCHRTALPGGFTVDRAHTGTLTAHTYSASADVQAALEYDQLQTGSRTVFLRHVGGAHTAVDAVASCVAMTFASVPQAARFFSSYRYTRDRAPSIVRKLSAPPAVSGVASESAYLERKQSFRGYGITSTNVVELAGLSGRTLLITSVAGQRPSTAVASRLLQSMAGGA